MSIIQAWRLWVTFSRSEAHTLSHTGLEFCHLKATRLQLFGLMTAALLLITFLSGVELKAGVMRQTVGGFICFWCQLKVLCLSTSGFFTAAAEVSLRPRTEHDHFDFDLGLWECKYNPPVVPPLQTLNGTCFGLVRDTALVQMWRSSCFYPFFWTVIHTHIHTDGSFIYLLL